MTRERGLVGLFLCGDVMTGRGIDQVLPHPSDPTLYEPYAKSAETYVALAEQVNGAIPRPVGFDYIWGDALAEIEARSPDLRLVNLETSVTVSEDAAIKGINYRMHPANVGCLLAARLNCCALANNHVLDWGAKGLIETLATLRGAEMATAGAGINAKDAEQPAVLQTSGARLVVFAYGSPTSGIPEHWRATEDGPGINLLPGLSETGTSRVLAQVGLHRRPGDLVVVSIHWGDNWGYPIPRAQREFAHHLIDSQTVDLVHGHSSHHAKGIEVYRDRLILYGCGDFINDYEGIAGREEYRPELSMAYFAGLDASSGRLLQLDMVPFRQRRFRLERASSADSEWLKEVLDREGRPLGTAVQLTEAGPFRLSW